MPLWQDFTIICYFYTQKEIIMSYNFDNQQLQRQIEDMQRQYRQYIT